jgi:ribonuclease G
MQNEIVINAQAGETRVAILEKGAFVDLHIERDTDQSMVGCVVKGIVNRVLPGMQAAFVDVGMEKAAFLYAGDYIDELARVNGEEEGRPHRRAQGGNRPPPPKIDTLLREGQEIVVQVAKEPIGTKGARITSHLSIPGRHLVLTPGDRVGVSRRIDTDRERRRLREIVDRLRPKDLGFIIRTAGGGAREADLEADIKYLTTVWDDIQIKKDQVPAPSVLYSEPPLPIRMIRDFTNSDTKRVVVDSEEVYERLKNFVSRFVAEPKPRIEHYRGESPIFDHWGLESQIDANLGRKVWLKSGGYLIVDQSEALTAIDVNTGRYVGKSDLEETVLKTNLEAVREVVHQLRFRNIGGLIIVDLIDMESATNREKVYRAFQEALRQDKARTNILKISEMGLVEMTRKRTRENLVQQMCEPCAYCDGRGYVLSRESVVFKVLREVRKDLPRFRGRRVAVTVNPSVASQLLGAASPALAEVQQELGREIEIRARPGLHQEQFELIALDEGPEIPIGIGWLGSNGETLESESDSEAAKPDESPPVLDESAAIGTEGGPARPAEDAPDASAAAAPREAEVAASEPVPGSEAEPSEAVPSLAPLDADRESRILEDPDRREDS